MDKKTKLWIRVMTISKKIWGCHQRPERSFFFSGYQFPLCARCTGVLVGYLLSFMLLVFGYSFHIPVCIFLLLPLVLDGGIQLLFNISSNNTRRFLTGIIFGIGFIQMIANILKVFGVVTVIIIAIGGGALGVGGGLIIGKMKKK
jgi:uncharacterized membrane protein